MFASDRVCWPTNTKCVLKMQTSLELSVNSLNSEPIFMKFDKLKRRTLNIKVATKGYPFLSHVDLYVFKLKIRFRACVLIDPYQNIYAVRINWRMQKSHRWSILYCVKQSERMSSPPSLLLLCQTAVSVLHAVQPRRNSFPTFAK